MLIRGSAIIAAFVLEWTTLLYFGLLRISGLLSMQPNLNIPLCLGSPDDRHNKVIMKVNPETFSRLSLIIGSKICRFMSFSGLKYQVKQAAADSWILKPEFLEEFSQSCELEEASKYERI